MKKYICLFLSTLMFLTVFSPVNCYARDGKKVIRVGFYTLANYLFCGLPPGDQPVYRMGI